MSYSLNKMLMALDIPVNGDGEEGHLREFSAQDFVLRVQDFLTEEKVRRLWSEWNADAPGKIKDPNFFAAFQKMLKEGASLGFKLSRFQAISKDLPIPTANNKNWIPFFEQAADDCKLRVHLSKVDYDNWQGISKRTGQGSLEEYLDLMVDALFYELGIVFPQVDFLFDASLPGKYFRIEWNDFVLPPEKGITDDKILVNDTVDRLTLLNIKGEEAVNPANGSECAIVSAEYKALVENAGLTTWDSAGYCILVLGSTIRRNASAFVNRHLVTLLLYQLMPFYPDTVSLIRKKFDTDLLVQILRGLLEEEISVRNLSFILEKILSVQSAFKIDFSKYIVFTAAEGMMPSLYDTIDNLTVLDHVEMVRIASRRYISHKYTHGSNTLVVYLMDPLIEKQLVSKMDLDEAEKSSLLSAVRMEVGNLPPTSQVPVILTTVEARKKLQKLVRPEFPHLAVVSYQELSPEMNIQPIARISPLPEKTR